MTLAIFDLDNTLLTGDSDYLWGRFLGRQGMVDAEFYEAENLRFYEAYKAGTLDIHEFLAFSLQPLAEIEPRRLHVLQQEFMAQEIEPIIPRGALELLRLHRQRGHLPLIITATNHFVTAPIARRLGVKHLLATDPEQVDGRYTGRVAGTPCFQEGKVTRLQAWLKQTGYDLDGSWFYSDSHNDLPLLKQVDHPVAVDPDEELSRFAQKHHWPVISLREETPISDEHLSVI